MEPVHLFACFYRAVPSAADPNGGFEDWVDEDGSWNPVGWVTTNGDPDVSVEPFSPACQGATSMLVRTWDPGFMTISGTAMSQFAYTERPTILSACLKSQ
ncbi:MAG: hypothetical protein IPG92_06455 [Flavobacteriales bacterium]|nr:hypothetical protein [Flavobacteriales bacterium]